MFILKSKKSNYKQFSLVEEEIIVVFEKLLSTVWTSLLVAKDREQSKTSNKSKSMGPPSDSGDTLTRDTASQAGKDLDKKPQSQKKQCRQIKKERKNKNRHQG